MPLLLSPGDPAFRYSSYHSLLRPVWASVSPRGVGLQPGTFPVLTMASSQPPDTRHCGEMREPGSQGPRCVG